MANNSDDDFWNQKSNEDFWNKSVIPDNWINNEVKKETSSQPIADVDFDVFTNYQQEGTITTEPLQKKVSAHLVIRLIFVAFTVLISVFYIVYLQFYKNITNKLVGTVNYTEKAVEEECILSDESKISMPQMCYTFLEADSQIGMPAGEKMISVYFEHLESDGMQNIMIDLDCYICYEMPEGFAYRCSLQPNSCYPILSPIGISKSQLLNSTIISSPYNTRGYLCFFVPDEVEEITFFVEEKREQFKIDLVESIYKKQLSILTKEQTSLETLPIEE